MDKILNAVETAERLGISIGTLYNWTSEGFIPHVKLGNRLRFLESELEVWLRSHSRPGRQTRRVVVQLEE